MKWSDIPFCPTARVLRQFAGAWLIFFGGAAALQGLFRSRPVVGIILAVLAVVVGALGLIRPVTIRWIFVGMMVLSFPIGWLIAQVMLAVLFFGIFTPVGLIFRLKRRDLLCLRPSDKPTYWQVKQTPTDVNSYFRQF